MSREDASRDCHWQPVRSSMLLDSRSILALLRRIRRARLEAIIGRKLGHKHVGVSIVRSDKIYFQQGQVGGEPGLVHAKHY
jgi:hypothetical protein